MRRQDWYVRLREWQKRTEERLRSKWWLWPIAFAADLIWHHIYQVTNDWLGARSGRMVEVADSIVDVLTPVGLAIFSALAILVGLAVHAYFDVRRRPRESQIAPEATAPVAEPLVEPSARGPEPMAAGESVERFREVYSCCGRTFQFAYEYLSAEICCASVDSAEKLYILALLEADVLPARIKNKRDLDSKLASARFTDREFITLKEIFRAALADYLALVSEINRAGPIIFGAEGFTASPKYVELRGRHAKCAEVLESVRARSDIGDIANGLPLFKRAFS
jgi:hypothetical protein